MRSLGDKIFSYRKPDLERNVDQFLRSIPIMRDKPPPISVEVALDAIPDVRAIEPVPALLSRFGVEALVLAKTYMHRDLTVVIDQGILDHRDPAPYHMALAEEIGHIQLHRAVMLDIQDYEDFVELQGHKRWEIAEHDAKYWGRALIMPRRMLEAAAAETYEKLASELGFADIFQFSAVFVSHLSTLFQIPQVEAQRRVDGYVGDLRGRLERSFSAGSDYLIGMSDSISVSLREEPTELTSEQLFGTR